MTYTELELMFAEDEITKELEALIKEKKQNPKNIDIELPTLLQMRALRHDELVAGIDFNGIKHQDVRLTQLENSLKQVWGNNICSEIVIRNKILERKKELLKKYKKITLKSLNKEAYPDLVVTCRIIENIKEYIDSISDEKKCTAIKTAPVVARLGEVGKQVRTTLITNYEGKDYILFEKINTIKEREINGIRIPDIVVTNINSASNEEYIIRADKFINLYEENIDGTFSSLSNARQLTRVSENIIIMTSLGEYAVCLAGSYITYDAENNDFNVLEAGVFESTYTTQKPKDMIEKQLAKV